MPGRVSGASARRGSAKRAAESSLCETGEVRLAAQSRAAFQPHVQGETGAQVDLCLELERLVGHPGEAVAARDLVQVHEHLVEREGLADAVAGAGGEWHVGKARTLGFVARGGGGPRGGAPARLLLPGWGGR